jgi:hypothetical protein
MHGKKEGRGREKGWDFERLFPDLNLRILSDSGRLLRQKERAPQDHRPKVLVCLSCDAQLLS